MENKPIISRLNLLQDVPVSRPEYVMPFGFVHIYDPNNGKYESSGFDVSTLLMDNTYFALPNIEQEKISSAKIERNETAFTEALLQADFKNDEVEEALDFIEKYNKPQNHDAFQAWLSEYFEDHQNNEKIIYALLMIFSYYPYESLQPTNALIASACKNHRSFIIQSATLSLLGHWCNLKALEIIKTYECPNNPWLKQQYDKLSKIIEERCNTLEK
jgi:hypothetical protein